MALEPALLIGPRSHWSGVLTPVATPVAVSALARGAPFEVAQIHGQQTAGQQRVGERYQATADSGRIGQVVEGVSDPDDRVHRRDRIVGQDQGPDVGGVPYGVPGEIEHRR